MLFGKRAVAWADLYGPFAADLLPGNVVSDAIFIGIVAERGEETFQSSQRMEFVHDDASRSASEQPRLRRESTCFDDGEERWREVPSGLQTLIRLLQASDNVTPVSDF
jgi:hypothetical protein